MSSNEQAATEVDEVKSNEGQEVEIVGEKKEESMGKDQQKQKVAEKPDTQAQANEESHDSVDLAEGGNESAEGAEDDAGEKIKDDTEADKSAANDHAGKKGHEEKAATAESDTEVNEAGVKVRNLFKKVCN
jgi:hypothetical protein